MMNSSTDIQGILQNQYFLSSPQLHALFQLKRDSRGNIDDSKLLGHANKAKSIWTKKWIILSHDDLFVMNNDIFSSNTDINSISDFNSLKIISSRLNFSSTVDSSDDSNGFSISFHDINNNIWYLRASSSTVKKKWTITINSIIDTLIRINNYEKEFIIGKLRRTNTDINNYLLQ